jgi:sugar/nucleoside kinase (ribokinase family)
VQAFGSERARETVATADVVLGDAAAMDALGSVSGPLLVTTLGRDGARCGNVHVRPPRVLDRRLIGSGDAFAAAVLVALAGSASVEEALTQGCEAGTGSWLSRADGSRIQQ